MSLPMRRCRIRNLLNSISTTDETDRQSSTSIKVANSVLKNLIKLDEENENDPQRVKYTDETFMDARIYNHASSVAYECISNVNYTESKFHSAEFSDKLIDLLTDGQAINYSLDNLYDLMNHLDLKAVLPCLSSCATIYGGISHEPPPPPKVRKEIVKETNQAQAVKKKLIKVVDNEDENAAKTDHMNKFLMKVLADEYKRTGKEPLDYYEFVVDTEDFGKTVENIFYTSFNINDGKMKLITVDSRQKLVPVDKKESANKDDMLETTQVVNAIGMKEWQHHCERVEQGILQRYRQLSN